MIHPPPFVTFTFTLKVFILTFLTYLRVALSYIIGKSLQHICTITIYPILSFSTGLGIITQKNPSLPFFFVTLTPSKTTSRHFWNSIPYKQQQHLLYSHFNLTVTFCLWSGSFCDIYMHSLFLPKFWRSPSLFTVSGVLKNRRPLKAGSISLWILFGFWLKLVKKLNCFNRFSPIL